MRGCAGGGGSKWTTNTTTDTYTYGPTMHTPSFPCLKGHYPFPFPPREEGKKPQASSLHIRGREDLYVRKGLGLRHLNVALGFQHQQLQEHGRRNFPARGYART